MVTFIENPYVWANNSGYIKSSVLSLDLKKEDGSRLNISGLSHPIELSIPEKGPKEPIQNNDKDHFFVKPYNGPNDIRYHKIVLESSFGSPIVKIRPDSNAVFDVFVSAEVKPKPDNYTFRTRIPHYLSCTNPTSGNGYSNCTNDSYTFVLPASVTRRVGEIFIGIRLTSGTNKRNKRSRMDSIDGHGLQKHSCIDIKQPPTTPPITIKPEYDNETDVNYTMSVTIKNCLYWSDTKQDWTNDGCTVSFL